MIVRYSLNSHAYTSHHNHKRNIHTLPFKAMITTYKQTLEYFNIHTNKKPSPLNCINSSSTILLQYVI